MEVSRTQVFADPEQGWALVEALIRDNLDLGRPDRVSLIFERKVTKRTPSEFHTRVLREGVQPDDAHPLQTQRPQAIPERWPRLAHRDDVQQHARLWSQARIEELHLPV